MQHIEVFDKVIELIHQRNNIENKLEFIEQYQKDTIAIEKAINEISNNMLLKVKKYIQSMVDETLKGEVPNIAIPIDKELSQLSVDVRECIHKLILEKTQQYMNLQIEAKKRVKTDLLELDDLFGNDEESKKMIKQVVLERVKIIMDASTKCITAMNRDMETMVANVDKKVIDTINNVLNKK